MYFRLKLFIIHMHKQMKRINTYWTKIEYTKVQKSRGWGPELLSDTRSATVINSLDQGCVAVNCAY